MATTTYRVKVPTISNFICDYYFSQGYEAFDARVWPPHIHDNLEFYVLICGDVSFMVENSLYKLEPGDIIVTKPNEIHNCILNSTSLHQHMCFWFDTACEYLLSPFSSHNFGSNNLISPTKENKEKLLSLYKRLEKLCEDRDKKGQFYTMVAILEIWEQSIPQQSSESSIPKQLQDILNDLNANFTQISSLDYFTDKYFISQSTLNRLFRKNLHTSPKMYLESKRLAYSRVLLKEGKSVFQSCISAGFTDYSNYIRLFKKRFGITPKQYQND